MLLDHPEVEWLGTTADIVAAYDDIKQLHPDTIVVEEVAGGLPAKLIDFLETENSLHRLVCISLDDNRLKIYSRENWAVGEADDLLRLILQ
jgi:hypothetical protein